MNQPAIPESDLLGVSVRFAADLAALSPALVPPGERLLRRLATPNWTLEWELPRWLAEEFALPETVVETLVLANVYGLAYVRLQDDLTDGDQRSAELSLELSLAAALHHLWVVQYVRLMGPAPGLTVGFWSRFQEYLSEWFGATLVRDAPGAGPAWPFTPAGLQSLAHRGAPIKIGCAAACLLAGREAVLPALASALDQLLAGAVLLDHAADWVEDLASGRYNALVAYATHMPQAPGDCEAIRRAVLETIFLSGGARPYFDLARHCLQRAAKTARVVDCPRLQAHLAWMDREAVAYAGRLTADASARLHAAVDRFMALPSRV